MQDQLARDVVLKKKGLANPHWHFEHDPSNVAEMQPLLKELKTHGIMWTTGKHTPTLPVVD